MKLNKEEICVYIENEAQLDEARQLLEKYGEKESKNKSAMDFVFNGTKCHYLTQNIHGKWYLQMNLMYETIITLQQLEQMLKAEQLPLTTYTKTCEYTGNELELSFKEKSVKITLSEQADEDGWIQVVSVKLDRYELSTLIDKLDQFRKML